MINANNIKLSYEKKKELWDAARRKSNLPQVSNKGTQERYKGDGVDSTIRNYLGYLGEQVVADVLGIEYEPRVENSSDPGYDLIYKDLKIGVKAKTYYKPDLFVKSKDKEVCDVYVVVHLDKKRDSFSIVGWVESDKVFEKPVIDFMNYGIPCRMVPYKELKPWEELLQRVHSSTVEQGTLNP